MQSDEFEEVLRFWFPDLSTADHAQMVQQFQWWFRAGADAAICERFANLLVRAIHHDLDHWGAANAFSAGAHYCSASVFPFSISKHGARIRTGSQGVEPDA